MDVNILIRGDLIFNVFTHCSKRMEAQRPFIGLVPHPFDNHLLRCPDTMKKYLTDFLNIKTLQ